MLDDQYQQVPHLKSEDAKSATIKTRIYNASYKKLNKNNDIQLNNA